MAKRSLKHVDYLTNLLQYQDKSERFPETIAGVRENGAGLLKELPFPQSWYEDWRFTDLRPLTKHKFRPAGGEVAEEIEIPDELLLNECRGSTAVFVDGKYAEKLSDLSGLPEHIIAEPLESFATEYPDITEKHFNKYAGDQKDVFTQFSSAFAQDGFTLYIPDDVVVEQPVHILNLSTDNASDFFTTTRNLVVAGKNSGVTVIEEYKGIGNNRYFTVPVSEFKLFEGAHVKHIKVQDESLNAVHVSRPVAHVAKNANYQSYSFALGAHLFRNDPHIIQTDEEVSITVDGLVLVKGGQISDTHSTMDHKFAFAESHQLHKVVADGKAHSIFNGKIFVRPHAQKIDSFQENRNLMLSRDCTINTKPQLEIFADDVKCSHGATVGQLEQDELFYLQSRGLSKVEAKQLLTYAFTLDIIENIYIDSLRERLIEKVNEFTESTTRIKQPV